MSGQIWLAPAKINLFLHITGRRPDGYHELQTVFQFLGLCDELRLQDRADGHIRLRTPLPDVPPEDDLTVRAARLLQEASGVSRGVDIAIVKRVPMGGGLGGGSSDAATTLVGLNRVWGLEMSQDELAGLGLSLGADVPVFVRGMAAWGEGVGEHLTPVYPGEPWYVVLHPGCHVSTAEIFSAAELTRNSLPSTIPARLRVAPSGPALPAVSELMAETRNDCEAVVFQRYSAVEQAHQWLSNHAPARMSVTGACLFAPFGSEEEARRVLRSVPDAWSGFVARGTNRSPLYAD